MRCYQRFDNRTCLSLIRTDNSAHFNTLTATVLSITMQCEMQGEQLKAICVLGTKSLVSQCIVGFDRLPQNGPGRPEQKENKEWPSAPELFPHLHKV